MGHSKFTVEITCQKCFTTEVEAEIGMGQGAGYVVLTCQACGNQDVIEQDH